MFGSGHSTSEIILFFDNLKIFITGKYEVGHSPDYKCKEM